jgi:beta-glucanase (GH16 family)
MFANPSGHNVIRRRKRHSIEEGGFETARNRHRGYWRAVCRAAGVLFVCTSTLLLGSGGASSALAGSSRTAAKRPSPPEPIGIAGKWNLILNSEFKGRSLNTSLWQPGWFGSGVTGAISGSEPACYSSTNVTLPGDGTLHLDVTATPSKCNGVTQSYTASMISTNPSNRSHGGGFSYRYGVLEAKVYIPGNGSELANWPSVVTFGQVWPHDGEDDVLEVLGGTACFHFHSPGYAPSGHLGGCDPRLTAGWHTVASDWQPGSVSYYFDGIEVGKITKGVTSAPMYIVVVNTVHSADPAITQADSMRVAYVRVWQAARPAATAEKPRV